MSESEANPLSIVQTHLDALVRGNLSLTREQVTNTADPEVRRALGRVLDVWERIYGQGGPEAVHRDNARFLGSIVENIPDMIFVKDAAELRFIRFNRAGEQLLGYERASLLGKNDFDFFPTAQAEFFTDKDREVLRNGTLVDIPEEPVDTAHLGRRYLHTKKIPILDEGGEPLYLLGISEDITERKQAAETLAARTQELARTNAELRIAQGELREREQELEVLLSHFPGAVWSCDRDLRIASTAGARAEDLGLGSDSAIGRRVSEHFRDVSGLAEAHAAALEGAIGTYEFETGTRIYEVQVEPLDGRGIIGVALDVTERRRLEAQRMEARLQEAQKLESLGLLAGGIAHDFNNLLVGILGNASLALMKLPEGSPARRSVERIELSADRAADLTRQMLAYSGKGRFRIERLDLSALVGEMANLLEVSISKKAKLVFDFAREPVLVDADGAQMRQLVMNLITNASDAIGDAPGAITLVTRALRCDRAYLASTYLHEDLPEGEYAVIEVSDSGVGMTQEVRRRMFDPFFSTKETGHGLGLAATLGIIRGHKGAVSVYSEPGHGTTMKVLFPSAAGDEASARGRSPSSPLSQAPSERRRVLIVDDEEAVRELATQVLGDAYEVETASDGVAALERYKSGGPRVDLVVLDLTMPRMSGEETFRALQALDPKVRVVLSSGYNQHDASSRFGGRGLAGFLQKPYRARDLLDVVASGLADH
jgi:two-component system cell cycle sensor histidine kinase/response regulator CckA